MFYSVETEKRIEQLIKHPEFSGQLQTDILQIISFMRIYSPLTDIRQILKKEGVRLLSIIVSSSPSHRLPLRNIIRLIAKLSDLEFSKEIAKIYLKSMRIGCNYFSGEMTVDTANECYEINYRWCWTDFSNGIGYDRFSKFLLVKKIPDLS